MSRCGLFSVLFFFLFSNQLACVERPMVLVITSYNNAEWYEKNLDMVFSQNYSNFRVIYVDDCSTDGTGELVVQYIKERGLEDKVLLIRNKMRMFKMYNLVHVIHNFCDDEDIVFDYDGDDWFACNDALRIVNDSYEDSNVWMTYGETVLFPEGKTGFGAEFPKEVIENASYRIHKLITTAPRTFYAWLFKLIQIQDLEYEDYFVKASIDPAYIFPMLEMAGGRFKFINDILYVHNKVCVNTNQEMGELQRVESAYNRKRKRYQRLRECPIGL